MALAAIAEESKYEDLVKKNILFPTSELMNTADSLLKNGDEEKAMVLYMMVASRSDVNVSDKELTVYIEANLKTGDLHYDRGNYLSALQCYNAGLKFSELHSEKLYMAVL